MNRPRAGDPSDPANLQGVGPPPAVGPLAEPRGASRGAPTFAHHSGGSRLCPNGVPIATTAEPSPVTPRSVDHHPMGPMDRPGPDSPPSVDGYPTVPSVAGTKPKTCRCAAYRWPHRPGGGLCRWPEPPAGEHLTPAGANRPNAQRRRGLRRTIMRAYGLHPIRDRAAIERLLAGLYAAVTAGEWPDAASDRTGERTSRPRRLHSKASAWETVQSSTPTESQHGTVSRSLRRSLDPQGITAGDRSAGRNGCKRQD